jgi:hypothetical protein
MIFCKPFMVVAFGGLLPISLERTLISAAV